MKTYLLKKRVSMVIAMVLMVFMYSINVEASESISTEKNEIETLQMVISEARELINGNSSTRALLYNCLINVYSSSNGMHVTFETDCAQIASRIGVKDIKIQQRVWYGWKTVATSSGGQNTNSTAYLGSILYTNAIKGENYRITCVHYADADEYTEVDGELEFIFTY